MPGHLKTFAPQRGVSVECVIVLEDREPASSHYCSASQAVHSVFGALVLIRSYRDETQLFLG